jgi:hypothetical protein
MYMQMGRTIMCGHCDPTGRIKVPKGEEYTCTCLCHEATNKSADSKMVSRAWREFKDWFEKMYGPHWPAPDFKDFVMWLENNNDYE